MSINNGIIDEYNSPVELVYRLAHYASDITMSCTYSTSLRETKHFHQESSYIRKIADSCSSLSRLQTEDRKIGIKTEYQFSSYKTLLKEFSVYILDAIERQSDKLNMQGDFVEPNAMYISKKDFIELRNSVDFVLR